MSYDKCVRCGGGTPPPEFPSWDDVWREHQLRGAMLNTCRTQIATLTAERDAARKALEKAEAMLSLIRHRGVRAALLDDASRPDNNQILEVEVICSRAAAALKGAAT